MWAEWKNPKTQRWEKTFATFTSEPNGVMRELHDRQPVILDPKDFQELAYAKPTPSSPFAPHPAGRGDTSDTPGGGGGEAGRSSAN